MFPAIPGIFLSWCCSLNVKLLALSKIILHEKVIFFKDFRKWIKGKSGIDWVVCENGPYKQQHEFLDWGHRSCDWIQVGVWTRLGEKGFFLIFGFTLEGIGPDIDYVFNSPVDLGWIGVSIEHLVLAWNIHESNSFHEHGSILLSILSDGWLIHFWCSIHSTLYNLSAKFQL